MPQSARIAFGLKESVTFGRPAAEIVAEEARRRDTERAFLIASSTLSRTTAEVARLRGAPGNRFAGLFERMPPHAPRHAVVQTAAMAREPSAGRRDPRTRGVTG
jgi:maleylacetate reductase